MADRSFLDWPFLEDRHRAFAADLEAWAEREAALGLHGDHDLDGDCRAILKALAAGGWRRHAVPDGAGGLGARTLCLTREALARRSGLADFVFAMQGLGSGPISLFGTDAQKARWLAQAAAGEAIAAFALSEPEAGAKGISAFVVDADTPGFEVVERIPLMAPHPLATLRFADCRVDGDRLLGAPGQGVRIAPAALDVVRSTGAGG